MEWLPVAVAAICALLSIPLSRILKINYWLLILTALSALLVTFAFPYFFETAKSLKELFANILFAGGALLLLLFVAAFIMLRSPKLTVRQARVQEEGIAMNTDAPAPSRYAAFRNALLTKEGPPDEVLIHAAYLREQALDPEPILTKRSTKPKAQAEAEALKAIAAHSEPEAQEEAEAPEAIAAYSKPEAQAEAEALKAIAAYSEPEVIEEAETIAAPLDVEVQEADAGTEPALMDLLDHAYTAMEAEDWQTACTAFKTALPLASQPYYIQRIKLELLNMLMRTGRKREAVDLVFDILGADYALSSAETSTLFNVLQDLQKGA
ncbi:MAG: hypothetical protein BWY62_00909 [Firmicutes bacterium ADurb.Bin356]|nr:MAG: hypothetical protein BWY62_00909 [Firmicutes bacterium ADurb.Bin356]